MYNGRKKKTKKKKTDQEILQNKFRKMEKIGEGTYGMVFKAVEIGGKNLVAVKKIRMTEDDEGIPSTAIREISVLSEMRHPNIVPLLQCINLESNLYLVFEYAPFDLKKVIDIYKKDNLKLPTKYVKKIMYQSLLGLEYMHNRRTVHRDLKPQNILVDKKMNIKICDFGLARPFNVPIRTYTHEVVTLWYRAPEILLGQKKYTTAIDIWSMGCILAELMTGDPLFAGDSELDEILKIFSVLGSPKENKWPKALTLPYYNRHFPTWSLNRLEYNVSGFKDALGIDLLTRMVRLNPDERWSASECLAHPFFDEFREKRKYSALSEQYLKAKQEKRGFNQSF